MAFTIFYSWQSDISPTINRNFIESVLKKVVKNQNKDITIQESLRDEEVKLDKDTKGVSGTPPIAETIFQKISECGIFVPDLTFVGTTEEGRLLQNPNVLVEYGWSLKEVTHARIVPVMNTAFGEPSDENLPFDMRHLRRPHATYYLPEGATPEEKTKAKHELLKKLTEAIGLVIKNNLTEKTVEVPEEIPYVNKPSTFQSPDEPFLINTRFGVADVDMFLRNCEYLFLRLIPSISFTGAETAKEALELAESGHLSSMHENPSSVWSYGRNKHGCFVCNRVDSVIENLTQFFLNGELWGIDAFAIDKERLTSRSGTEFGFFVCNLLEGSFMNTLTNYLKFASETLELKPPLKLVAGATDVKGYKMLTGDHFNLYGGNVVNDEIIHESIITDYSIHPSDILQPFFTKIWSECGLDRPK